MGNDDKLSAKPQIDTTDFKTGVAQMNRELRLLESGFRANTASMGDWSKSATGLEARLETLNSKMEVQKQKIAATRAEWERIKAENGENSRAAQEMEIKLNQETAALGKMQAEASDTFYALQEVGDVTDDVGETIEESGDQVQEAGGKFEGFKSVLSGIGPLIKGTITVVLGLAAAVAGITASIGGLVFSSADAAAQLVDLSAKTGISTTQLQELSYIGDQVGTSLDTITGAQARLIRSMAGAQDQTQTYAEKLAEAKKAGKDVGDIELGDAAKAFQELGVAVTDSNGQLRSNQDVFNDTIDALGKIQNPAERDALAMELFGKSAQELNPLIKTGSAEMARLAEQAHNVGAVMSEEDVASLEAFDDTLASLKAGLKGTLGTLATAFLPGFQAVFGDNGVGKYLKEFSAIVSGSNGDFGKLAQGLTGLITEIATDVAQQAPQMLQAGLSIVQSILDSIIAALPSMLTAAIQILSSLIDFIVQNLPTLLNAGIQIVMMLVNALITNLPMLIDAGLQAIITLANGLTQSLPTLIPAIIQAIITIVQTLIANLPMLIDAALQLILALAQGLIVALPILIAAIPQIVTALLAALQEASPMMASAAGQLIGMLGSGLINNIPVLISAAADVLVALVKAISKNITENMPKLGRSLLDGLMKGINDSADTFLAQISQFFANIITTAKEALGIHSPSKYGVDMGENLMLSPIIGAQRQFEKAKRFFKVAFGGLALAASTGMATGSTVTNTENTSLDIWGNVIIQGDTPPKSLGGELRARRF